MKPSDLAALACAISVACGGSQPVAPTPPPPAPTGTPSESAAPHACGVALFGPGSDPFCQKTLDETCCAEEKQCAADATCKALLERVNACPLRQGRETEECVMRALPQQAETPGYARIGAIAKCAKRIPPSGDRCSWPD
jgi:hypothetical protein